MLRRCQDYQSRAALAEKDGLSPLLDLIRSEYPVIQHLALVSLHRASEDRESAAAKESVCLVI